jgi:uncharacterized protein YjiS (DUF1127 family)
MSIYDPSAAAASFGARAATAAMQVASLLTAPIRAMIRHERIRRTALVLDSLDDRTLSDIGLRRAQILSAAVHTVDGRDADRWRTWI